MKTKQIICNSCKKPSKYVRPIAVDNMDEVILCNSCNMRLIQWGEVPLRDDLKLKTFGLRGDFTITKAVEVVPDFWATRRKLQKQAQMDNQSMLDSNEHQSY
jgi:hypothetical protein